jgi:hypothetical protein
MGRFLHSALSFRPINIAVMVLARGFVTLALGLRFQDVFGFDLLRRGLFLRGRAARGTRTEQADTGGDRQRAGDRGANRKHR